MNQCQVLEQVVALLGQQAEDKVTGFKGVITSVCFDLYGCIQVILTPKIGKDGKKEIGGYYDANRLKMKSNKVKRVMPVPSFDCLVPHGPAEKTLPESQ